MTRACLDSRPSNPIFVLWTYLMILQYIAVVGCMPAVCVFSLSYSCWPHKFSFAIKVQVPPFKPSSLSWWVNLKNSPDGQTHGLTGWQLPLLDVRWSPSSLWSQLRRRPRTLSERPWMKSQGDGHGGGGWWSDGSLMWDGDGWSYLWNTIEWGWTSMNPLGSNFEYYFWILWTAFESCLMLDCLWKFWRFGCA